ncbi:RNA-binding protein [Streptomyces sp. CT34]|uniref:RNA recognition motif domain-containing protein n=1 Tax=Streptomyces sp. CT34 TaxID=1553907 RepID=UPI0005B9BE8B|nr:RNA-binding protein [Streptomyces sp. CT34]
MANRLYVGNLSFDTTEDDLYRLFGRIGEVDSAQVLTDRGTNRSRGFGFVDMSDRQAAKKAVAQLQGAKLKGRAISVSETRPMPA